jgi:menaquinone-dependent protoporphyrinogen oxidase
MDKKVLVAYASKYGATAEIAEQVGEGLKKAGLEVEVLPAEKVKDLGEYGAVVLGSAVYAGQWRKEASDFLQGNEQALKEMPVWLFSSGPTGEGDPVESYERLAFPGGASAGGRPNRAARYGFLYGGNRYEKAQPSRADDR